MAISNLGSEDPDACRQREEQLLLRIRDKVRSVISSPDGCGEVTIYIKARRGVRITVTNSELITL